MSCLGLVPYLVWRAYVCSAVDVDAGEITAVYASRDRSTLSLGWS
ncbi:MAG: hypothetical protein QXV23_02395 [Candidatus Bathyarchaeia archaeon]